MTPTATPPPTRRLHVTREEEADRCLNHTTFSKGAALGIAGFFLAVIFGIPLAQHVVEIRHNLAERESASSGRVLPQVYDVFGLLPSPEQISKAKGFWGYWSLIPSGESISSFEASLKENSILTKSLLSPTQAFMTDKLGVGNEKAYVGKDGWLFYRPDVEYLTSDGFLDPVTLKQRSHGAKEIQPDPVKAIVDFRDQLQDRGIKLIVMPMTTKPMVYPEKLAMYDGEGVSLQNPSFGTFRDELVRKGVTVYDPTDDLIKLKWNGGSSTYLKTDTHWTPAGLEAVVAGLSDRIPMACKLPVVVPSRLRSEQTTISGMGDIAEMLKLPSDQRLFPPESVTVQRVLSADGQPWSPDRNADVLVLGDSFTNIYSLEGMGWGTGAGFAERLSYRLGRPVDKIAINAGGSFASRRALAQDLARGNDRLAGKRLVIYEFSMRDLSEGDWKMIPLKRPIVVEPKPQAHPTTGSKAPVTPTVIANKNPQVTSPQAVKPGTTTKLPPKTGPIATPAKQPGVGKTIAPAANPSKTTGTKPNPQPSKADGLVVTGRIAARAKTPAPGSVPYKDCLIALQLTDLKSEGGTVKGSNIVVYVYGMRDNKLVDGDYSVGQTIRFKLVPWAEMEAKVGGLNRQDLDSDEALSWTPYWGVISK